MALAEWVSFGLGRGAAGWSRARRGQWDVNHGFGASTEAGVPHCCIATGLPLARLAARPPQRRGFLHLFIPSHASSAPKRPQSPSSPPSCLSFAVASTQFKPAPHLYLHSTNALNGDIVVGVFFRLVVALSRKRRGGKFEPVDLRTRRKTRPRLGGICVSACCGNQDRTKRRKKGSEALRVEGG